jgi:hypothetical protein
MGQTDKKNIKKNFTQNISYKQEEFQLSHKFFWVYQQYNVDSFKSMVTNSIIFL